MKFGIHFFFILFFQASTFAHTQTIKNPSIEIRCQTTLLFLKDAPVYRFVGRRDYSLAKSYSGIAYYTTPTEEKTIDVQQFRSQLDTYLDQISYTEIKSGTPYNLDQVVIEQLYSLPGMNNTENTFLIKDKNIFEKFNETIEVGAYFKTTFYGEPLFTDAICQIKQYPTQLPQKPIIENLIEIE